MGEIGEGMEAAIRLMQQSPVTAAVPFAFAS
jgi:hypothetical protein